MPSPVVVTDRDVAIFRAWLKKQPHLPQDEEDHYIKSFIVGAKGSIQKAKSVFENYCRNGYDLRDLFGDFDPVSERLQKFNNLLGLCRIPMEDHSLIATKLFSPDPTHYDISEFFARHFFNSQVMLWDNAIGNGQAVILMDCTGVTIGHVKSINPIIAEKLMTCVVGASPIRIKAIHIYNLPSVFQVVYNLFAQFMPEKIRNRVQMHTTVKTIQEAIPKKFLPEDYGGDLPSMLDLHEKHMDRLRFYRENLMAIRGKRIAEAKFRPKSPESEAIEMTGTFRKLTID